MSLVRRRRIIRTDLTPEQRLARREDEITMRLTGQTPADLAYERAVHGEPMMPWDPEHLKNIGATIVADPGYVGPTGYPPLKPEETARLSELARLAHEARVAFDALKDEINRGR